MKRSLIVAGMALAIAGTATAAAPSDRVTGALNKRFDSANSQSVRISARSGPAGENPKGQVQLTVKSTSLGNFRVKGTVTCLFVQGTSALVAAVLDKPHDGNTHLLLLVVDDPDETLWAFRSSVPPNCGDAIGYISLAGEPSGNITVTDAG